MSDAAVEPAPTPTNDRRRVSAAKRFRYKIEGVLLRGLLRLIQALPHRGMLRLADGISATMFVLLREDRRTAMSNLDLAFGDTKTPAEKTAIARSAFRNLCRTLVGLFWAPNLTKENVERYGRIDPESLARVQAILASGRGVLFCTPHLGNWELAALLTGFAGIELLIVAEPTKNPEVGHELFKMRSVSGHKVVPPAFAMLKLFRQVARGGATAMLVDVNGRRKRGGVWNDFFGLPVFNSIAVAELALRTKAAIVMGVGWPQDDGTVTLTFYDEIGVVDTGDRAADQQRVTDDITRYVERLVRENPQWWLWTYKRWKRRPSADQGRYPSYSKFQPVE